MLYNEFFCELGLRNLKDGHLGRHLKNSNLLNQIHVLI